VGAIEALSDAAVVDLSYGISAINIVQPGSGYSSAPTVTVAAPAGTTAPQAVSMLELGTDQRARAVATPGQAAGTSVTTVTLTTEPLFTTGYASPTLTLPTRVPYIFGNLSSALIPGELYGQSVLPIVFPADAFQGTGNLTLSVEVAERNHLLASSTGGVTVFRGWIGSDTGPGKITFSGTASALSAYFSTPDQVRYRVPYGQTAAATTVLPWKLTDGLERVVTVSTTLIPLSPQSRRWRCRSRCLQRPGRAPARSRSRSRPAPARSA
jgi:hypothetical protein